MLADILVENRAEGAAETVSNTTFLDRLHEAAAIVRKHYPGAQLLEADIDLERFGCGWRFVFDVPAAGFKDTHSTAILCHDGARFQTPQHIETPWLTDKPIPLPIELDIQEAEDLAQRAGYTGEITSVHLRWVLHPGIDEPHYILTIPERDVLVFVGVYTRKVTVGPLTV